MPSNATTTGGGAELTAVEVLAMLLEPLMAQSVVLASGPKMFNGPGPFRVPRIVDYMIEGGTGIGASPTAGAAWVGESEPIPEADPTYGEFTLLPTTRKSLKVLHRFSSELARMSVVNVAAALQQAIVRRVGLALDLAFLDGTGVDNTILGIARTPGIIPATYDTAPTLDDLIDAQGEAANVNSTPSVWFSHPDVFTGLRKLRDGSGGSPDSGGYLVTPDATQAGVYRLLGLPLRTTTQLDPGTILLVDMSEVAVARDLDASVKLLDQTYAATDELALRVVSRFDLGLIHPEAVVKLTAA